MRINKRNRLFLHRFEKKRCISGLLLTNQEKSLRIQISWFDLIYHKVVHGQDKGPFLYFNVGRENSNRWQGGCR